MARGGLILEQGFHAGLTASEKVPLAAFHPRRNSDFSLFFLHRLIAER